MLINRKRICVNRQLHPEIFSPSLASLRNKPMRRELLRRRSMIARLFRWLSRHAPNMQCLFASAVDPMLSRKGEQVIKTVSRDQLLVLTAHTGMSFREVALSGPRSTHLRLGSGIK
jgi:hypothetical protein